MNKKLFSWKALAGLALLVAVGLTSCKQGTEVDPTDPYSTKKPTTPSASTKGTADVTITIVAGTDLIDQYGTWVATLNADQKKAIQDAKEFTIGLNVSSYKLDGKTLTIPAVWSNPADKTLNLVFNNGFAEAKNALIIDADSYVPGANVNITLPGGEYAMNFTGSLVRPVIKSEAGATVTTFAAKVSSIAKNTLTIGDGVTVKVLDANNDVKLSGTAIAEAVKLAAGTYTGENNGTIKKNGLNFKNIEVAGAVTVKGKDGDHKLKLESAHIAAANTLTIGGNVASIANVYGDLDSSKKLQAKVVSDAIVGKFSKVILTPATTAGTIEIKDGSNLDNVEITSAAKLSANIGTVAGVIFDSTVDVIFDKNDVNINFNGVKFGSTIGVSGEVESEVVNTYATYKYSVATGWAIATDDASVPVNADIASFSGGKFYKADGTTEVIPSEDVVRFKTGSTSLTTMPSNVSITLDKASVDANGLDGTNVTTKFGGAKVVDPGYAVILNDVTYTWKKVDESTKPYQLRK